MNLQSAYAGTRPAEVTFDARVTSAPHFFYGSNTHCMHEAFDARTAAGAVEIVDNVAIAPRVPVQPGDTITVRGEMVHDPGRMPIVHWTHHDPGGRHEDGFIRYQGRVYA
jgi:acetyltransferase-like isoleucine patch superfamily enzyme